MLVMDSTWNAGGHRFARWTPMSRITIRRQKMLLEAQVGDALGRNCMHLKGRYGMKRFIRIAYHMSRRYPFVACFDVLHFYESIKHDILLREAETLGATGKQLEFIRDYISLPDIFNTGIGLIAGSAASPLLGAIYLAPLDRAMVCMEHRRHIVYRRYMDDFFIFAKSKWKLREAIKLMYQVLDELQVGIHRMSKRFIGRSESGFDVLGYSVASNRALLPSMQSIARLNAHIHQLKEQGANDVRLRQYVLRWVQWLLGGLPDAKVEMGVALPVLWHYCLPCGEERLSLLQTHHQPRCGTAEDWVNFGDGV